MNKRTVEAAVAEAERFLERARELPAVTKYGSFDSPRHTGALRRASMDLTRALADLRRPA